MPAPHANRPRKSVASGQFPDLVLGIDLGTTKAKVVALDPQLGAVVASADCAYSTVVTEDGGSEQNPSDWWSAVCQTSRELFQLVDANRVAAVGLSGHMHGLLLLDQHLDVVRPAMTWSDRRVSSFSEKLRINPRFKEICGNEVVDAFTAPKLAWLSINEPESLRRAKHLLLAKDYIAFRLTGEISTDRTDAIGTLLWDLEREVWDDELFAACHASSKIAPEVVDSSSICGTVSKIAARETGLRPGTPVVAGAGDVSAVALGSGLSDRSVICLNVGTAAQALGVVARPDPGNGFLFGNAMGTDYLAMSSVYAAGASVQWAEKAFLSSQHLEGVAETSPPGAAGLSYLPFMFGSVEPRKNDAVRGAFVGQTSSHEVHHFGAAVLEGVAFACADAIEAIAKLTGRPTRIHLVGGVANSAIWRRAFASVLNFPVMRLPDGGSAVGASLLASIGAGLRTRENATASLTLRDVGPPEPEVAEMYREARVKFIRARDLLI